MGSLVHEFVSDEFEPSVSLIDTALGNRFRRTGPAVLFALTETAIGVSRPLEQHQETRETFVVISRPCVDTNGTSEDHVCKIAIGCVWAVGLVLLLAVLGSREEVIHRNLMWTAALPLYWLGDPKWRTNDDD